MLTAFAMITCFLCLIHQSRKKIMSLIKSRRKIIKVGVAAKMLGISSSAIRAGAAGTGGLTLLKFTNSKRLYCYEDEVERLISSMVVVRSAEKRWIK
jgi:uncharacterized radical SAM superfamily protein